MTPNGDGINDDALISYQLLQLTRSGRASVAIHNLSGDEVWRWRSSESTNGEYVLRWNGRDLDGHLVPPGMYFYRILVETDIGTKAATGVLSLVY
jgi:flagellar hook assembly protein FlgD